jgi:hypothetical protein
MGFAFRIRPRERVDEVLRLDDLAVDALPPVLG